MKRQGELAGAIIIPGIVTALLTLTQGAAGNTGRAPHSPNLGAVSPPSRGAVSPLRPSHLTAEEIIQSLPRPIAGRLQPPEDLLRELADIPFPPPNPMETAMDRKVQVAKADFDEVPGWDDMPAMMAAFASVRDGRFMMDGNQFARRPTWLYPDDGCYSRAELMVTRFEKQRAPAPAKIFIFGNLTVKTPNTPSGTVEWWYHVVVAYKHKGSVFVVDPSVDPRKPMTLQQLAQTLGNPPNLEIAVCAAHTYGPTDPCGRAEGDPKALALADQRNLFDFEWTRLRHLNRNPYKELGDFPPWKAQTPPSSARTRK